MSCTKKLLKLVNFFRGIVHFNHFWDMVYVPKSKCQHDAKPWSEGHTYLVAQDRPYMYLFCCTSRKTISTNRVAVFALVIYDSKHQPLSTRHVCPSDISWYPWTQEHRTSAVRVAGGVDLLGWSVAEYTGSHSWSHRPHALHGLYTTQMQHTRALHGFGMQFSSLVYAVLIRSL